jgi:hypothetical protein
MIMAVWHVLQDLSSALKIPGHVRVLRGKDGVHDFINKVR